MGESYRGGISEDGVDLRFEVLVVSFVGEDEGGGGAGRLGGWEAGEAGGLGGWRAGGGQSWELLVKSRLQVGNIQ